MRKILYSSFLVLAVAAVAGYATYSYFSDTETSTGNTFTAGDIDLKISNESYVSNKTTGALVASPETSWVAKDLIVEKFFNFTDLKPGDLGEDTIDLTVTSNDAWACAEVKLTKNDDVTSTEPELGDGDVANTDSIFDGELAQGIEFIWWSDDGDNVLEANEEASKYYLGPDSITNLVGTDNKMQLTLADKYLNFFDRTRFDRSETVLPIKGGETKYIGKAWCFGDMTLAPVSQDGSGKLTGSTNGPLLRGTGFTCNGANVNNVAQTDSLTADISFTVVQARNNMNFLCPEHTAPTTAPTSLRLENETEMPAGTPWTVINDNTYADLTWSDGNTFNYTLKAQGLANSTAYDLIYYADGWPGNHPGKLIGTHTTTASGTLDVAGNPDLGMDLPMPTDGNYSVGAKIWLVLANDYDEGTRSMTAWNPSQYLFEGNVYIHYNDTNN